MNPSKIVALLPAAGRGTRLGKIATSKELVAVGTSPAWPNGRPVIDHLLERLALARIPCAEIITLPIKSDIEATLGSSQRGIALHYQHTAPTPSSVHTLATVIAANPTQPYVLGYPDILFEPRTAYRDLLPRLDSADVVLGLFPSDRPTKTDMVALDNGAVTALHIKQPDRGLRYTWSIACWSERFSRLLLDACETPRDGVGELFVGHVIQRALRTDLRVEAVTFAEGWALDVGTPDDLARARRLGGSQGKSESESQGTGIGR